MKKVPQHDWTKTIKKIQALGLTQTQIEKKTGVRQNDISRLKTGALKDVIYSRGVALMKLLGKG